MKRLILALLFLVAGSSFAGDPVTINRSSFTKTNESVYISSSSYLDHVIVGVTSAGGVLVIYNSTYTATSVVVASITLGTVFSYDYSNLAVKGIYYATSGNTNGVSIIYKN